MAARRFRSKTDPWIFLLLIVVIAIQAIAIGNVAMLGGDPLLTTLLILVIIAFTALMIWLLLGTHYTVERGVLRIACGPFRWKVPLDQISSVTATRSPLSSPALSLDRLCIRYGKRGRIMISPADRAGFLKAIGHELEN